MSRSSKAERVEAVDFLILSIITITKTYLKTFGYVG